MSWPRRIFFALAAPVAALVFSLVVSGIVLEISGHNAIDAFKSMWQYTDSTESVVATINRAIPYYVSALAVAIGFKMALFNIGVDGQLRMAAVLAAAAGAAVNFTVPVVQVTYIILVAVAVGAAWAFIAAILKVWRGVSEVISTIMLNSIATALTAYLLANYLKAKNAPGDLVIKTRLLPPSSFIPPLNRFFELFGFHLPPNTQLNGFFVGAVLLGVGFYVLVWRTRFGFDLRASGANPAAARAAGVNPKAMIVKTMLISGGIAGLVAIGPLLGDPQFHRYGEQFPTTLGFTGIAVALVGRNHPVGIAFSALLFAYIERATQVLALQNIPQEISKIMQGSIILSAVIAYEIVRRARVAAEVRDAAAKAEPRAAAGGAIPEPVPA
ncbi:MAG TPA: ABC transporter permease [Acidimicrobiales bacterium]|nr:ABC transporter permease [Acidimicrobiales bacterium]